ncbi:hypothetical protein PSHT_15967 [Puccinia striiformis]|uniref:Uncharacterized protein n=1 Tax=Puccinia striiformis TaxID=27350 RepID=A0A2S4UCI1_9BASI|nr:hypothetical protein PSHT_15967 [Puccinia striiformis]
MSDVEDTPVDVAEEEVEATKEADAPKGGQMSVDDALKKVLKTSLVRIILTNSITAHSTHTSPHQ